MNEFVKYLITHGLVISGVAFVIIFALERIFPKFEYPRQLNFKRVVRNVIVGVTYRGIFSPVVIAPLMLYVTRDLPYRLPRPDWFTGVTAFVIDIFIMDCLNYLIHLSAHKIPVLWRFHTLHHLDMHIDSTTGFRQHFGEKFLVLAIRLPVMYAFAIPYKTVIAFEVISFCVTTFHHSNINIPEKFERALSKIFVMPTFHNIHHGREVEYTDTNYGFIFSIWDRLFGTYSIDYRPEKFSNGLDHHDDFPAPKLLYLPFTTKPVKEWT
ncbi:sterol desaturase family protein [Burkholderia ubonensis]|uniref:sterol desaturase family protein n=1 Tax=Burkholderia ubonensis TaxID=101571 RepID=UPI00016A42E5|nr:sterol desaturase family protein [Burkholderia ubonensis]